MGGLSGNTHAFILNLAGGAGIDADDGPADGGLAGAGLADQREGLSLIDVKGGILDGADRVVALAKGDVHILETQQNLPAVLIDGTVFRQVRNLGTFFRFCHNRILLKY